MTRRQEFLTADVLQLQVEDNLDGRPVNLVANPSGELGGWGWLTPVFGTYIRRYPVTGTTQLIYVDTFPASLPSYFTTEAFAVDPGRPYFMATWFGLFGYVGGQVTVEIEWLGLDDAVLGTSTVSPTYPGSTTIRRVYLAGPSLPVGTAYGRLRFDLVGGSPPGSRQMYLREVTVLAAATAGELTPYAGVLVPPAYFVNVLGSTHQIDVDRQELDLGTLNATVVDSTLDPAYAESVLQTGRRVRLLARTPAMGFDEADYGEGPYGGDPSEWLPLFTGTLDRATVTYDLKQRDETKRTRIVLTALDPLSPLAQESRTEGVGTIPELPYLLEGAGIPWNVNGSGNQIGTAVVVVKNEGASAVDQVAATRDSVLGYAWCDQAGVLQVWDRDEVPTEPGSIMGVATLDEADYGDFVVDYDTDRCINEVRFSLLVMDAVTGDTQEIAKGPYRDEESIRVNRVRSKTFTVQGVLEADLPDLADVILSANAWPRRVVQSVSIPIVRRRLVPKALIDLGDVQRVINGRAGVDENLRVVGVGHSISTRRWSTTLTFAGQDRVAPPQVIPTPSGGAGGLTAAQLYRPLGELTPFYGLPSQLPAGWLLCDGSLFDPATYPRLQAHLAVLVAAGLHTDATRLPLMTDRIPIGAGTKALGTAGDVGDTGTLRWRALYFMIRAV